jgi:hypothetical protein
MEVREIDFNALPQQVRLRFIAAVNSKDAPDAPLLREVAGIRGLAVGTGFLLLFAYGVVSGSLARGFGELGHDSAWQSWDEAIWPALVLAGLFYAALTLWRRLQMRKAVPFMPGRYLFPLDLVDAQTRHLKIYPLAKLAKINGVHHSQYGIHTRTTFTLTFEDGSQHKLDIGNKAAAEEGLSRWNASQDELRRASAASEVDAFAKMDPFSTVRAANWKVGTAAAAGTAVTARDLPKYLRWRAPIAMAAAVLLCALLLPVRNLLSDSAIYKEATRLGTERAYLQYLDAGWRHVDEIRAGLPRAAFNDAKKKGTATAFRSVGKRYPKAGLGDEIRKELTAIYAAALANFRTQAATSDATLVPFMEQLLSALNAADSSTLQIRFTRPSDDTLKQADARIAQSAKGREVAPVARHFASDSAGPRETRIVNEMTRGFRAIFPSDVLNVAPVSAVNAQLPVMDVAYGIAPSGTVYKSDNSERLFVGVNVHFDVGISVPGKGGDRRFSLDVRPPERFTVNYTIPPGALKGVAPDERVYVVMAERAFDELGLKLRSAFFHPDSQAFKQAESKNH